MNAYIIGKDKNCLSFLENVKLTSFDKADVYIFYGIGDVHDNLRDGTNIEGKYDIRSENLMKRVFNKISSDKICIGIGKGAQLLNVLNGGSLLEIVCHNDVIPHVTTFIDEKQIEDYLFWTNSFHNKVMYPWDLDSNDWKLLAYSRDGYVRGFGINDVATGVFPEVIDYHLEGKPRCLCIQPNPELTPNAAVAEHLNKLINNYVSR